MKIYEGARSRDGAQVRVRFTSNGQPHTRTLDPRHDLRNHSPDGFEWGYGGSGPAQLALAICADALGDDARAQRVYHLFKFRAIATIHEDDWTMTQQHVLEIVREIESNQPQEQQ
jgi:hypothetical protein